MKQVFLLSKTSFCITFFLCFLPHCSSEAKNKALSHSNDHETNKNLSISNEFLAGKFSPAKNQNFIEISSQYSSRKQYIDKRTFAAFEKMAIAAQKDGFDLTIISATRNFHTQKIIWDEKFNGKRKVGGENIAQTIPNEKKRALRILEFSSMPGTSRHHWGTDIDLHEKKIKAPALYNSTFKSGRGKALHDWLTKNAPKFDFCQPYTGDPATRNGNSFQHGYREESWHWSYTPLSKLYLQQYTKRAKALKPSGYAGDNVAAHFYLDFVQNVDPTCR
ncbi:MAG TPA: M15 family metallopeptidase [Turneriella sp.]|nr:M15 family metallopeptidase [Turneriella sp.]